MTNEQVESMLLMNEQLASDIRQLTYKVSDLTEVVENLTHRISKLETPIVNYTYKGQTDMGTKGYMEHMRKVNKGLEYMYPNRGKGINRKNIPRNPTNTQNKGLDKKVQKKVQLRGLKFAAYQPFSRTSLRNMKKSLKKSQKVLDKPLTVVYIKYVRWLKELIKDTL